MTRHEAYEYWLMRYNKAKDYDDPHWEVAERHEHEEYVEALHDTNDLMNNPSRLHHKFSPLECEQIIKDKYGIDLRAEFRPQVEIKRR